MKTVILKIQVEDSFPVEDITNGVVELYALADDGRYSQRTVNIEVLKPMPDEQIVEPYTSRQDKFENGAMWMREQIFGEEQP